MFEGFRAEQVDVGDTSLFVRWGGQGPPLLLLHGHPRTSATWHRVAPRLVAAGFSVVCPDLRGYGRSGHPTPTADHAAHSKRATANDLIRLMSELGHRRFDLAGHDRGSYVALRLALDHPDTVRRLALLDCIPISEHLARADADFATRWWHWFFYAQPEIPERVINADPDRWYHGDPDAMGQENYDEWRQATRDPDVVRAMLEDYRAGLTVDREHEEADRAAGRKVESPLLVLWSTRDDLEDLYGDPLTIWRSWATSVVGHGIDSGHHLAEEAPEALATALATFFSASPVIRPQLGLSSAPGRTLLSRQEAAMRISDILRSKGSDVISITPESSVIELVALLQEHNLGAVVVSPDGRTIAGIVSERDVIRRLAAGTDFLTGPVASIMTADVYSCSPEDTVPSMMSAMTDRRVRHLPVVDQRHELHGIVSIGDLVKSQISELQFERDQLQGYVSG